MRRYFNLTVSHYQGICNLFLLFVTSGWSFLIFIDPHLACTFLGNSVRWTTQGARNSFQIKTFSDDLRFKFIFQLIDHFSSCVLICFVCNRPSQKYKIRYRNDRSSEPTRLSQAMVIGWADDTIFNVLSKWSVLDEICGKMEVQSYTQDRSYFTLMVLNWIIKLAPVSLAQGLTYQSLWVCGQPFFKPKFKQF